MCSCIFRTPTILVSSRRRVRGAARRVAHRRTRQPSTAPPFLERVPNSGARSAASRDADAAAATRRSRGRRLGVCAHHARHRRVGGHPRLSTKREHAPMTSPRPLPRRRPRLPCLKAKLGAPPVTALRVPPATGEDGRTAFVSNIGWREPHLAARGLGSRETVGSERRRPPNRRSRVQLSPSLSHTAAPWRAARERGIAAAEPRT